MNNATFIHVPSGENEAFAIPFCMHNRPIGSGCEDCAMMAREENIRNEIARLRDAVDEFAREMKLRLEEKARCGFTGWDGNVPEEVLCDAIASDVTVIGVGEPDESDGLRAIDIANRAMFIWWRRHHE